MSGPCAGVAHRLRWRSALAVLLAGLLCAVAVQPVVGGAQRGPALEHRLRVTAHVLHGGRPSDAYVLIVRNDGGRADGQRRAL